MSGSTRGDRAVRDPEPMRLNWQGYVCAWTHRRAPETPALFLLRLQMLYEIGQAKSKPCGINLARANTLGGLLIIEKASAPINVAL